MQLSELLSKKRNDSAQNMPSEIRATMANANKQLKETGIEDAAPKQGDLLKTFSLPNQNGQQRKLSDLLEKGPVVLTFYRGGWCPYCNMELAAYQDELDNIKAAGATLVAITPELPDESLSTSEKNALSFEILSDAGAVYARELGLVFTLPEEIREIYQGFNIDLEKHNGKGQYELPLAATFIINKDGTVKHASVDVDYTYRQEPSEVVALLNSL